MNNSQTTTQNTGRKRFYNSQQNQQPSAEIVKQKLALIHEDFNKINSGQKLSNNTDAENKAADDPSDSGFSFNSNIENEKIKIIKLELNNLN